MKSFKRIMCLLLTMLLLVSTITPVMATNDIKVKIDGKQIAFDVPPQSIHNRTMVPLRAIFEALGATVEWDGDTQGIRAECNGTIVLMFLNDTAMYVNGAEKALDSPACAVNGRTLVPVRAISEALGATVEWDGEENTVLISKNAVVESIRLATVETLTVGETKQLNYSIYPEDAVNKDVEWESSDTSVVTVDNGKITAIKEGYATIKVMASNGKFALCVVNVEKRQMANTTVYEDQNVKINFLRVEKSKYDDDEVKVFCDVQNKTNETLRIQCDALSLNGYCFNNVIMSDDVSANSIGTVETTLQNFNFSWVDIDNITTFGGEYRIISKEKNFKTYEATFINKSLYENKVEKNYPNVSGKELLYSDNRINMYFDYAENDDEDLEVYLIVQNKTDETIRIQNNTVVINNRSYNNTIISDDVLAYSTGNINVTVRDAAMGSVSSVGGEFRVISKTDSFRTYTATLSNKSSSVDDKNSSNDTTDVVFYKGVDGVPDFGAYAGISTRSGSETEGYGVYMYSHSAAYGAKGRNVYRNYSRLLVEEGFELLSDRNNIYLYHNKETGVGVGVYLSDLDKFDIVSIIITD